MEENPYELCLWWTPRVEILTFSILSLSTGLTNFILGIIQLEPIGIISILMGLLIMIVTSILMYGFVKKKAVFLMPYIVSNLVVSVICVSIGSAMMLDRGSGLEGFYYFLCGLSYPLAALVMLKYRTILIEESVKTIRRASSDSEEQSVEKEFTEERLTNSQIRMNVLDDTKNQTESNVLVHASVQQDQGDSKSLNESEFRSTRNSTDDQVLSEFVNGNLAMELDGDQFGKSPVLDTRDSKNNLLEEDDSMEFISGALDIME